MSRDPVRVQPVERLVEDENRRVADERGGQGEALAHAEREPADPAVRGIAEADQGEQLVHAARDTGLQCARDAGGCGRCGWGGIPDRAPRRRGASGAVGRA